MINAALHRTIFACRSTLVLLVVVGCSVVADLALFPGMGDHSFTVLPALGTQFIIFFVGALVLAADHTILVKILPDC